MSSKPFFGPNSPYFNHPLLTGERTKMEIDFLQQIWNFPPGSWILDAGCGFGRHSLELARRGYAVTGIDPSQAMIERAQETAASENLDVRFQQTRAEDFTSARLFSAAICLFTSLGQITGEGDSSAMVPIIYAALEPGGWFIVEVPQRDAAVNQLRATDRFGGEEVYTEVIREIDSDTSVMTETFKIVDGRSVEHFKLQYRLFSESDLIALLTTAGFQIEGVFADFEGNALTAESDRMLFLARKP